VELKFLLELKFWERKFLELKFWQEVGFFLLVLEMRRTVQSSDPE